MYSTRPRESSHSGGTVSGSVGSVSALERSKLEGWQLGYGLGGRGGSRESNCPGSAELGKYKYSIHRLC